MNTKRRHPLHSIIFAAILFAILSIFTGSAYANDGSATGTIPPPSPTPAETPAPVRVPAISIGRIVVCRVRRGDGSLVERPAIAVQVWSPECANLQVFMDGDGGGSNDASPNLLWVTSAGYQAQNDGSEPREKTWFWPARV